MHRTIPPTDLLTPVTDGSISKAGQLPTKADGQTVGTFWDTLGGEDGAEKTNSAVRPEPLVLKDTADKEVDEFPPETYQNGENCSSHSSETPPGLARSGQSKMSLTNNNLGNNNHHRHSPVREDSDPPPVFLAVADSHIAAQVERYVPEARPVKSVEEGKSVQQAGDTAVDGSPNNYLYILQDHENAPSSGNAYTDGGENANNPVEIENASPLKQEAKQNSFVTIFSIWNTMMGTSILAMPWVIQQAGFATAIVLILFVAALACYTGYLTLSATNELKKLRGMSADESMDFTDACQYHLGKAGRIVAIVFSQFALIGALIVYYVLLTNFLYNTGDYIYRMATHDHSSEATVITIWNKTYSDVICNNLPLVPVELDTSPIRLHETADAVADPALAAVSETKSLYHQLWSRTRTVPAWLLLLLFPLISIRSPGFLGKFTALGTVSVGYLFVLVCIKTGFWGFNMDFFSMHPYKIIHQFRPTFASLTGVCSLAFFIHNALHTLMRNQRRPENNGRDIVIAFGFTTATYTIIGVLFFAAFPLAKSCIEDNFLNNLSTDIPVFIGRLGLLFQMLTVYPMLVYVLRVQIMVAIFKNAYPSCRHVFALHVLIVGSGLTFAMVLPKIGTIIRFSGALCGLVYIFTLPPLISLLNKRILYKRKLLTTTANGLSGHKLPVPSPPPGLHDASGGSAPLLHESSTTPDDIGHSRWWLPRVLVTHRLQSYWYLQILFCGSIIFLGVANFVAQFVIFFTGAK